MCHCMRGRTQIARLNATRCMRNALFITVLIAAIPCERETRASTSGAFERVAPRIPPPAARMSQRTYGSARTGKLHDPIRFPRRPTVRREGLLPVACIGATVRPDEANENHSAFENVLAVEFAAAVPEGSGERLLERARRAVRPVDRPVSGVRVVESERQAHECGPMAYPPRTPRGWPGRPTATVRWSFRRIRTSRESRRAPVAVGDCGRAMTHGENRSRWWTSWSVGRDEGRMVKSRVEQRLHSAWLKRYAHQRHLLLFSHDHFARSAGQDRGEPGHPGASPSRTGCAHSTAPADLRWGSPCHTRRFAPAGAAGAVDADACRASCAYRALPVLSAYEQLLHEGVSRGTGRLRDVRERGAPG